MDTRRLGSDRFGGLGADRETGCGGRAEGADSEQLGYRGPTVIDAVQSEPPPRYERWSAWTSFTSFDARIRALLE